MHSLLIISQNKKQREEHALKICIQHQINRFDITVVESEQALGIADVRNMQKKIFLKPLKSKEKAIIINNAHTATPETQNALLKILEEPPLHTIIILTATTENAFLPTILSRCKVIKIDDATPKLSPEEIEKLQNEVKQLTSETIGFRLKFAQDLAKDKEHTILWLQNTIHAIRITMLAEINHTNLNNSSIDILQNLQTAYLSASTTNINLRFLLENTFLKFSKTY